MSLLPRTLAGRIALLLTGALVLANAIAVLILLGQQREFAQRLDTDREIERVLALVPALDAVRGAARQDIAREAATRFLRATVDPAPVVGQTGVERGARFIANRLSAALDGREVAVALRQRPVLGHNELPQGPALAISIALAGEPRAWLNITSRRLGEAPRTAPRVYVFAMGVALLIVLGLSLLMARHLTRPLRQLAQAAEAAGRGDRTARVPEEGVREVQEAARAFNAMQAEIARFDAERLRTLGAVGHDLRTPMTSLRLRAEMVEDESLRAPMIRTLDEMSVMADGLVSYARSGAEDEARVALDLAALLAELCAERGAVWHGGPALDVQGRPVALKRVFGNLIDNALRYAGAVEVTLAREHDMARVSVRDTGPGIPEERLAQMFAPFTRGEDSRNLDSGGAGLGLAIVHAIVTAHGGRIALRNRSGGGLAAEVWLPLS